MSIVRVCVPCVVVSLMLLVAGGTDVLAPMVFGGFMYTFMTSMLGVEV